MKFSQYRYIAFFMTLTCCLLATNVSAQETISFKNPQWDISAKSYNISMVQGKEALYLESGKATLKDVLFKDGIIEYDFLTDLRRGFSGVQWRIQPDGMNTEEFYIRHHQGGNPDANQYSPIFNGLSGWQIYYGPHYASPVPYPANTWMHVKIIVSGDQAEVYIDSEDPVLFIDDLKGDFPEGGLALASNYAPAYFANFKYQKIDKPALKGKAQPPETMPKNVIKSFDISKPYGYDPAYDFKVPGLAKTTEWTKLNVGTKGIGNIARVATKTPKTDTVLARVVIHSDRDQVRKLSFGYSDYAMIFLNGMPLFEGNAFYTSRDYRYLGTVGFQDIVFLNLKKGENILYFAISEGFGGWAVAGAFDSMEGLTLK